MSFLARAPQTRRTGIAIIVLLSLGGCGDTENSAADSGAPDAVADSSADSAPDGRCQYMGRWYETEAVFPAGDGCNSCQCNPLGTTPGQVGCTLVFCPGRVDGSADGGADGGGADGGGGDASRG